MHNTAPHPAPRAVSGWSRLGRVLLVLVVLALVLAYPIVLIRFAGVAVAAVVVIATAMVLLALRAANRVLNLVGLAGANPNDADERKPESTENFEGSKNPEDFEGSNGSGIVLAGDLDPSVPTDPAVRDALTVNVGAEVAEGVRR